MNSPTAHYVPRLTTFTVGVPRRLPPTSAFPCHACTHSAILLRTCGEERARGHSCALFFLSLHGSASNVSRWLLITCSVQQHQLRVRVAHSSEKCCLRLEGSLRFAGSLEVRTRPRSNCGAGCAPRSIRLGELAISISPVAAEEFRVQPGLGAIARAAQLLLDGRGERVFVEPRRNVDPELTLVPIPVPTLAV